MFKTLDIIYEDKTHILNKTSANKTCTFQSSKFENEFLFDQQVWGISYSLPMPELQLQTASADSTDHVRSTLPP